MCASSDLPAEPRAVAQPAPTVQVCTQAMSRDVTPSAIDPGLGQHRLGPPFPSPYVLSCTQHSTLNSPGCCTSPCLCHPMLPERRNGTSCLVDYSFVLPVVGVTKGVFLAFMRPTL